MATRLETQDARSPLLAGLALICYVVAVATAGVLFGSRELWLIVPAMGFGTGSLTWGLVTRRQVFYRFALLDAFAIFFASLSLLSFSNRLPAYLWISLAQFLMLLLTIELVEASSGAFGSIRHHVFSRLGRIGMILASCYVLSVGSLAMGSFLASSFPLIADVSLYIVVVSVSLPLLLILRENRRVGG